MYLRNTLLLILLTFAFVNTVEKGRATRISTLPVITQCRANAETRQIEMMVAIRDPDNLIDADFTDDDHKVLEVVHDLDNVTGVCSITKSENSLDYFKVSFVNLPDWTE